MTNTADSVTGWLGRLGVNSLWMALAQASRAVETIVRTILIARALSVTDFAAFAVVMAFVSFAVELLNLNVGAVVVNYGAKYRETGDVLRLQALIKTGYVLTFVISILAALFCAGALTLSYDVFLEKENLLQAAILLSCASALNLFEMVNKPVLRLLNHFKTSCVMDLILVSINLVILWVILSIPETITTQTALIAVAITTTIVTVSTTLVAVIISIKAAGNWWKAPLATLRDNRREIGTMMVGNSLSNSLQRLARRGDVLLLAALSTPTNVAIYDLAKKTAGALEIPRGALALAVGPQIAADVAARRLTKLRSMLSALLKAGPLLLLVAFAVLSFIAEPLVVLLYGAQYSDAAFPFVVLACAGLVLTCVFWSNSGLLATGQLRVQFYTALTSAVIVVGVGALVCLAFGTAAALSGVVLCAALFQAGFVIWRMRVWFSTQLDAGP